MRSCMAEVTAARLMEGFLVGLGRHQRVGAEAGAGGNALLQCVDVFFRPVPRYAPDQVRGYSG